MPNNDTPISSFQDATEINSADKLTGLQNNVNRNFSFSTILSWFVTTVAAAFVPVSRKVNNKALSADITLDASDVGAQAAITASGILKGDGAGGVSAATSGTDYQAPLAAGTDYATPAQLADKANQAQLATVETGPNSSKAYAVGEYFCWNGLLYRVKTAITSAGVPFNVGANCEAVTVGDRLSSLYSALSGKGNTKYTQYYATTAKTTSHSISTDCSFLVITTGVSSSGDRGMGIWMGFCSASSSASCRAYKVFEPSGVAYPCTVSASAGQISVVNSVAYVRITILEFERTVF